MAEKINARVASKADLQKMLQQRRITIKSPQCRKGKWTIRAMKKGKRSNHKPKPFQFAYDYEVVRSDMCWADFACRAIDNFDNLAVKLTRGFREELHRDNLDVDEDEHKCSSPPSLKRQSMRLLGGVSEYVSLEDVQVQLKRAKLDERARIVREMEKKSEIGVGCFEIVPHHISQCMSCTTSAKHLAADHGIISDKLVVRRYGNNLVKHQLLLT